MRRFFPLLLVTVIIAGDATAQPRTRHRGPRLLQNQPTVYITFVRTGERESIRTDQSDQGVWLRLHNNTRWRIYIRSITGAPSVEGHLLLYEIVPEDRTRNIANLPIGESSNKRTIIDVPPGKSVLFSVAREHLAPGLTIGVAFLYIWELSRNDEPEHLVYFGSSQLPASFR